MFLPKEMGVTKIQDAMTAAIKGPPVLEYKLASPGSVIIIPNSVKLIREMAKSACKVMWLGCNSCHN